MEDLREKIGYLRGILENREPEEKELFHAIVDALQTLSARTQAIEEDMSELSEYVESIDEDLNDLEALHDEEEGMDFPSDDDDAFDEDFDGEEPLRVLSPDDCDCAAHKQHPAAEPFVGCLCPDCGKMFFVPVRDAAEDGELYVCPHCEKAVPLTPLSPENTPIARRAEHPDSK